MKIPAFSSLCFPSKVYLAISLISTLFMLFTQFQWFSLVTKIFFVGVWTWILNILCKKGYETLALVLVALPYVMFFVAIAIGLEMAVVKMVTGKDDDE